LAAHPHRLRPARVGRARPRGTRARPRGTGVVSTRLRAYVTSLVLLGAVAWPMFRSPPADSYPLSSYPMFSRARPPFADIEHVVAVSRDGSRRPVPPSRVASGEVLQAKVAIARTLAGGRRAARALCTEVAS